MAAGLMQEVAESLHTLFDAGSRVGASDPELLEQFTNNRGTMAESAFAALVARHGPMVRRVCRSLLDDPNDAEDAFQASFLVLARKAGSLRRPELLGNWLIGTAHRAARKLRRQAARRRKHEGREARIPDASAATEADHVESHALRREQAQAVLEEVARLARPVRAAVLLCDLQGMTQDEAAARLRCSDRTLRRRLKRGHDLLRNRLSRRGLAPAAGLLATAWTAGSAPAEVPEAVAASMARAATNFTAGGTTSAVALGTAASVARALIGSMVWTKVTGVAFAMGAVLAFGLSAAAGLAPHKGTQIAQQSEPSKEESKAEPRAVDLNPSPASQYRVLVKQHDNAMKAAGDAAQTVYNEVADQKTQQARVTEIYERLMPKPAEYAAKFLALAERYPKDPIAVDASIWIVEKTLQSTDWWEPGFLRVVGRAMEFLAHDHAGEPRLGPLCFELTAYESPNRDRFLRAIAERSPNRVVKGQATSALAQYLWMKALHVEMIQHPDAPENVEKMRLIISTIFGPDSISGSNPPVSETPAMLRKQREDLAQRAPDYLKHLLSADSQALRRESEQLYARVIAEYGDLPYSRIDGRPTRQTLADVARRSRRPATTVGYKQLEAEFNAAEREADRAAQAAGTGEAGVKAYLSKAPKWADFGPRFWSLAESDPRSPAAFDALLWIIGHYFRFFDAGADRDATASKAIDVLLRDHSEDLATNLASRNVATALNHGSPMPGPHVGRLYRALYERSADRATRGRMGLALAQHLRAEAELADSIATPGADPGTRLDLAMWPSSYIEQLKRADPGAMSREAEAILERVKAEYGDVRHLLGEVLQPETLSSIADRELADLRTLRIGQPAPEISGEDVDGKPMKLSEFRGKVVLLDFGSHEHCGGCRLVYPRLRKILDQYKGRPFVILGINNNDKRDVLKAAHAGGEIIWRCWWDGDRLDGPGPITTSWNIRGYPSFIILDHRGVIRHKDLHPEDLKGFGEAVEALLDRAERDLSKR